jgi:hypothetical protein
VVIEKLSLLLAGGLLEQRGGLLGEREDEQALVEEGLLGLVVLARPGPIAALPRAARGLAPRDPVPRPPRRTSTAGPTAAFSGATPSQRSPSLRSARSRPAAEPLRRVAAPGP